MIDEGLLTKFASIEDLPISEEMLGAYLEGSLSEIESKGIESKFEQIPSLNAFISNLEDDVVLSDYNVFESEFDFSIPTLESMNNFMIEDINISQQSAIYEAQKHFGLEPLNIDFDPNIYQWEQDTCAVRSQEIVLRSYGIFVSQDDLVSQAAAHGWYSKGGGTPMEAVGNLLDLYNVPNHRVANANVFNLADELGQGHKVIVGVDVDELYGNSFWQSIKEHLVGKTPNHAMIVSGLDTSDPNNTKVILTDPGTGKTLFEIPYDKFLSAWNDSDCFMVATNEPAPLVYNPDTMMNFDYSKGHVASLGSIPFDDFHNHVVPDVDSYLDSVDEYIASLEQTMINGFNLEDFNHMMDKANTAHDKTIELQLHNASHRRAHQDFLASNHSEDSDDENDHKDYSHQRVSESHDYLHNDEIDDDDFTDDDTF